MLRKNFDTLKQCCRSMTFWGGSETGSGSADPRLWLIDPDQNDPDPQHWLWLTSTQFLKQKKNSCKSYQGIYFKYLRKAYAAITFLNYRMLITFIPGKIPGYRREKSKFSLTSWRNSMLCTAAVLKKKQSVRFFCRANSGSPSRTRCLETSQGRQLLTFLHLLRQKLV